MKHITIISVILMMLLTGILFADERITSADKALKRIVPCNGEVEGPIFLETLFKGAIIPQYVCYHDIDGDEHSDVVLIYIYNANDTEFELIRAMRLIEYYDVMENEHAKDEES